MSKLSPSKAQKNKATTTSKATAKAESTLLLYATYKNHWQFTNGRNPDYAAALNDGLALVPNCAEQPATTALLAGLVLTGQNRIFTGLEVPYKQSSPIVFCLRLYRRQNGQRTEMVFEAQQTIPGGNNLEWRFVLPPLIGEFDLEFSTRMLPGDNTSWAWAYIRWPVIHGDDFHPVIGAPPLAKVLEGKDGWLFLDNDTNENLAQVEGRVVISDDACLAWQEDLKSRRTFLENLNIPFRFQIVPNKESVFPEKLPDHLSLAPRRSIHKFIETTDIDVLYPLEALYDGHAVYSTYLASDTHWSDHGSLIAANEILASLTSELGVLPISLYEASFQKVETSGDLGIKVTPQRIGSSVVGKLRDPRAVKTFDNGIHNQGRMWIFESDRPGPKAILFGDSFSVGMVKWLAERFSRLVYVHSVSFDPDLVEEEKPDAVIFELVVRFIIFPPISFSSFSINSLLEKKYSQMPVAKVDALISEMKNTPSLTNAKLVQRNLAMACEAQRKRTK